MNLSPFLSRKLLFVTGKGGIGKSLVTAALGQAAAAAGKRVLLIESSAHDQLSPLFGHAAVGHNETKVAERLSVINLAPPDTFEEYVVKYLGQKKLFDKVFTNKVVRSFINTVPGFAEIMMLGRLFYTCELAPGPRHDLVIFDAAASGHFLSLMTTPDAVLQSNLGGPLAKETARIKEFMANPAKCGVAYVGVPEELVVSEILDFLPKLESRSPAKVMGLFVNRVPTAPDGGARDAATTFAAERRARADAALKALAAGLGGAGIPKDLPVWQLPDLGFVPEPLPSNFGPELFSSAKAGAKP